MSEEEKKEYSKEAALHIRNIIAAKFALDANERFKGTQFWQKELKMKGNLFLKVLLPREKFFDRFEDEFGDNVTYVYNCLFDTAEEIATLDLDNFEDILNIIKAYKKNKNSIIGIAKKINK